MPRVARRSPCTVRRSTDPDKATQQEIRTIPDQGKADTEEAIDAAYAAFAAWSKRTPKERHDLLMELYRKLQEHAEDLAHIIVAENGKSLADAKAEVAYSNSFVEWFAEEALRVYGRTVPSPVGSVRNVVIRQPVGVAGLIAPWNFPLGMITRKVGPALAAGCTVVIKAPHEAPFSAFALAQLAEEVGIPAGVLNVLVSARGENESQMGLTLCESPKVHKISFTGSTRVGKLLMGQSASTLKKLSMELGGNAPFIVFDDADVSLAVDNAIACKFRGGGQTCISANRIYVHDAVFDEFSKGLAAKVADFKVGYGMDKDVRIGPLVNEGGQKKVGEHVAKIKEAGGEILVGGEKGEGLFFEPTVAVAARGKHMVRCISDTAYGRRRNLWPRRCALPLLDRGRSAGARERRVGRPRGLLLQQGRDALLPRRRGAASRHDRHQHRHDLAKHDPLWRCEGERLWPRGRPDGYQRVPRRKGARLWRHPISVAPMPIHISPHPKI